MAKRRGSAGSIGDEWSALEEALAQGTVRGRSGPAAEAQRAQFDADELVVLERLARRSRLAQQRSRISPAERGNVIFLPGITGSDLATINRRKDRDHIWINIGRIITGRIAGLRLAADGDNEADPSLKVEATRINKRFYARAVLALRAHWNVLPFPYDWRRGIDKAADALAAFITEHFAGQPVHLVAHSMGGLVARTMILRHPELWEAMQDHNGNRGGRLIMLGTPNYGSYTIVQAMTGEDKMIRLLEKFDLPHNLIELLEITNTFLGSYHLLPSPEKLPPQLEPLYQSDTWNPRYGVSQRLLNNAFDFHAALQAGGVIDPQRMIYVAGHGRATLVGMSIREPGDFDYELSYEGDGRVPHALGLLPGVPTYFVNEVHGDLARNERILLALDSLLTSGQTDALSKEKPPVARGPAPTMREYLGGPDRALILRLEALAAKAEQEQDPRALSFGDGRLAEDVLIRAALGGGEVSRPVAVPEPGEKVVVGGVGTAAGRTATQEPATLPRVQVQVRYANIETVEAPALVVGHYEGVAPSRAIGALDKALGGWISRAIKHGMIGGRLGETFYIPTKGLLAADSVVIAGMGEYGAITEGDLRILNTNVALGTGALGYDHFATVLIGSGTTSISSETALRALFDGVATALAHLGVTQDDRRVLRRIVIVENNPEVFLRLADHLEALENASAPSGLRIVNERVRPQEKTRAKRDMARGRRAGAARSAQLSTQSPPEPVTSLTVELSNESRGRFLVSALTGSAVIPLREVEADPKLLEELTTRLQETEAIADQQRFGELLYQMLIPEDFDRFVDGTAPLRLVVDRNTASIPWEMACYLPPGARRRRWLGVDLRLSRQFRTLLSRPPGTVPAVNQELRVLVVADPAPEPELQLPGARAEGRAVAELFRSFGRKDLRVEVDARIGPNECSRVEILADILTGRYDILHFAGHADYDRKYPDRAGWIFGADQVVTAREIFSARTVPRLVFANACFSGVIHEGRAHTAAERSRGTATIAQAFFERGVPNYIGSGWPVDDRQARSFAEIFYAELLQGASLKDCLRRARAALFATGVGSTWGAYQHYGDPGDILVPANPGNPAVGNR